MNSNGERFNFGYRVRSIVAARFRQWASARLKEYLIKGFALDLYATSLDYDPGSPETIRFFQIVLNADELRILNNLVSGSFDFAEIAAIEHRPMDMADYIRQLDAILSSGGRALLTDAGTVSRAAALEKAHREYRKYQQKTLTPVEKACLDTVKAAEKEVKAEARKRKSRA